MKVIDDIAYNGHSINSIYLGQTKLNNDISILYYDKDSNQLICSLGPTIEHNVNDMKYKKDSDFWDKIDISLNSITAVML